MHWRMLALLTLARTVMGFQFQSVAAAGGALSAGAGLDAAMLGALIGVYLLPGIVTAVPSGWALARLGDRPAVLVALGLMAAGGVAMALPLPFEGLMAARAVAGIGGILINIALTKMVTDWFAPRGLAGAMGIFVGSWPAGVALALLVLPLAAGAGGWAAAALPVAAACVLAAIAVGLLYRAPGLTGVTGPGAVAVPRRAMVPGEVAAVLLAGLVWALYNVGLILALSFAPAHLEARGMGAGAAGGAVSLMGWLAVPAVMAGGMLIGRLSRPDAAVLALLGLAAAGVLALAATGPQAPWLLALLAVTGVAIGLPAGALVGLPARVLAPPIRALGMGIFFLCYYLGMGMAPPLAGLLREATGDAAAPVRLAAGLVLLAGIVLLAFRGLERAVLARRAAGPSGR